MEDNIEQPQVEVPQQETPKTGDLDKLYAVVNQAGLYTKSKDEFIKKYSTPENIDKLHTVVSQAGLYTKSKDDFYSKYYPDLTKQTTEPQQPLVTAPKQQPVTTQDLSFKNLTKTLPTGGAVPKKEGSWKNIVQNVAANVELAGTKLASGTANIVRDISNKIIKEPELFDKEGKLTKEAANISWTSDPLGKIILGLNGNKQRMEGVIENNQLPNTFLGNVAQSASELFPDLAATAALPETKVPELAGAISKTIATLGNTFTKYLATKGALTGYEEAKSHGQSMVEASNQGFKGLLKGAETGVEMAALGVGSNSATNSVMKLGEKVGLTGAKGVGAKELVNLATDVAAYGLISPYSHSVIEGTPLTAHDIANGAGIAAAFRIKGTAETLGKHYELNRVLKETQDLRQGVALSNFSDATPESIHEVYKMPESAEELNLKALQFTKEAKATTDLEKKQNLVAKAIMYTKASNVKGITEQIVNNPSSLEEVANSTDIPDNLKKPFLEKATQVSELINQPKEVAQEQPKIENQPTETIPNEQGQEQTTEIQQSTEVEKPTTEKVSEVVGEPKEGEGFKNRVFEKNIQLGEAPKDAHISEEGYNYRVLSNKEIEAIKESGSVLPREGKQKGGNENTKYWTKGNGENWYGDKENQETVRVKEGKFKESEPVKAEDLEVYNKETKQFEPLIKEKSTPTIKEEVKGETKTETPKVEEKIEEPTKQVKINDLVDRVQQLQKLRANDPKRAKEVNDVKLAAKELGLEYKDEFGKLFNPKGIEIQKREPITNKTVVKDFDRKSYSKETNDAVDFIVDNEHGVTGFDIRGTDGKRLSAKQRADALKSIKEGKPNYAAKAVFDFIEQAHEKGGIELEDVTSGKRDIVPIKEYFDNIKTEEDKINDYLKSKGEEELDIPEEHINNLIEQYETEFKAENQQPTSESEGNVSKETSTGTSTKENGKENTKLETPKTEQNALQEPSTGSVLQHPQEGTRGQGGESGRMESSIEGEKVTKESGNGGGANTTDKNKDGGNEEGLTGITHAETDKVARELGLPEYEKTPETVEEWDIEADRRIKEEKNAIPKLLDKLKEGKIPSEVEQRMMLKYLASLKAKINKDPLNDKLINEYKEGKELSDVIGGREVAKSLVARKGLTPTEDSIGDLMVRQMEVLGVDKLTEKQKEDVIKNFEEVNKAKEEAEAKIKILADENAKLRALFEFNKTKSTTQRKSKQEITKERESIKQSIKDKWNKASNDNTLTAVPLPYAKQLSAIAPDVAKLMRSYVEEGATSLNDVVKKIIDDVKEFIPEITDKDVNAIIAGEYNEKKQTKNEITAKLVDLRNEARLIGQYEELENGVEPISEKKKTEKNQQLAELRKQIKEHDLTKLANIKKQIASRIEKEEEKIKNKDFAPEVKKVSLLDNPELKKRFPKQYKEAQDARDRLNKLKIEREVAFLKQQYANRSGKEKFKDAVLEILNLPRTIMSSMDFSAPLRQGVIPTVTHPFIAAKAFKTMFQHAFNQKAFDRWFMDLRESDAYKVMEKSGLYVADPHDLRLTAKEESFMNNLAEKIPFGIGTAIKGSERAYVSYLNKMRVDLFRQGADAFLADGKTPENSPELYKGLASWVNNSTGRGGIGKLENASPILSAAFFSPRLIAARLNALNPVYYAKLPKEVRVAAVTDMIKFIALGATALTIAHINGASVQLDPRSSDFGKIKVGDTRYDIWGGFGQYIRVLTQLITAQSKSAQSGKIQDLSGKGAFGKTRASVAIGFLRGKLAPVPATTWDFLSGRTAVGEKVSVKDEVISHFTPLIYSDVKDAFKQQGVKALFTVGLPSTFGVGVQTYLPKDKKTTQKSIAR